MVLNVRNAHLANGGNRMHRAILSALLLVACVFPCHAADPRLAQKVTYQGGYKRLHAVAEELTKQTGVTIRSGSNSQDWQVRDIPLVVCVKDMPLGKLLRTVADCGHVTFAMEKIANAKTDKPAYKLYRTRKQREDIDGVLNARVEANRNLAEWSWDTLVAYADMPDASKDIPVMEGSPDAAQIRAVARMLKSLGPGVRTRTMSGERVVQQIGVDAQAPLKEMLDYAATHYGNTVPALGQNGPPQVTLALPSETYEGAMGLLIQVQIVPDRMGTLPEGGAMNWVIQPSYLARALASAKKLGLPAEPDTKSMFADDERFPEPGFVELKTDDDWKAPLLQCKVSVPASQAEGGKRVPRDLVEMARQSGMNIVCEDFVSHLSAHEWWGHPVVPGSTQVSASETPESSKVSSVVEMTASEVLKSTNNHLFRHARWFVNKDSHLIVGWLSDWRVSHLSLVPESLYVSVTNKMQGSGAELNDVIPLADLNWRQFDGWFRSPWDLSMMMGIRSNKLPYVLWRLYCSLNAEQRRQARSDVGLSLAGFGLEWAADRVREVAKEYDAYPSCRNMSGDREASDRVLASPALLGTVALRVSSEPDPNSKTISKHIYAAAIESTSAGRSQVLVRQQLDVVAFPVYTPAREAELRKKAEPNPADKKPVEK